MKSSGRILVPLMVTALMTVAVGLVSSGVAVAKSTSPAKWAPQFCTALSIWSDASTTNAAEVQAALTGVGTGPAALTNGKALLSTLFTQATSDADNFLAALTTAGAPSSTNGTKIQKTFVKTFQLLRDATDTARTKTDQLSTTDAATFSSAASAILKDYQSAYSGSSASFKAVDKLDSKGELSNALKREAKCKFLTKSSS